MLSHRSSLAIAAAAAVLLVGSATGGAVAGSLITGAQIKNGTITSADLKNKTIKTKDLSGGAQSALRGPAGPTGPQGARGTQGPQGVQGAAGVGGVSWAQVTATGVITAQSGNVTVVKPASTTGIYCLTVTGAATAGGAVVTPDFTNGTTIRGTDKPEARMFVRSDLTGCPTGTTVEVLALERTVSAGAGTVNNQDEPFIVVIP